MPCLRGSALPRLRPDLWSTWVMRRGALTLAGLLLGMSIASCGEDGSLTTTGATPSTVAGTVEASDPMAICDQYPPRVEEGWVTVRAETATAEQVAAWQEEIARRSGGGIVSQYRQRPPSEELTVCLYWGSVPAPGGPRSMTLPPYDASTWVIDSYGHGMPDTAGWTTSLTELPSDVVGH